MSGRSWNWRRGLLRLWFVASVLWIVSTGWVLWPGVSPLQFAVDLHRRAIHAEMGPIPICPEQRPPRLGLPWEVVEPLAPTAVLAYCLPAVQPAPPVDPTSPFSQFDNRAEDQRQRSIAEAHVRGLMVHDEWYRIGAVERWLAWVFLPPFALLLAGKLLWWVARGFSRSTP